MEMGEVDGLKTSLEADMTGTVLFTSIGFLLLL